MGGKKWKSFMAKLYGFGAAIVIVGAMFKIMHWPGAGPMLVVGLSTEAVIFFFSHLSHHTKRWIGVLYILN
jgi:gliding motility-associated protein GldL